METEPARIVSLTNAAVIATLAVFTALGILDEKVSGALGFAISAWVLVAGEWLRGKVIPVGKLNDGS